MNEASKPALILTPSQLHILGHAVGWPKQDRNYFCAIEGFQDHENCELLVSKGLMLKKPKLSWVPEDIYHVTAAGIAAIKEYEK